VLRGRSSVAAEVPVSETNDLERLVSLPEHFANLGI